MAKNGKILRLGISFGAEDIHLVQTEKTANQFKVTAAADVTPKIRFSLDILSEKTGAKTVGLDLKSALSSAKITARNAAVSLDLNFGVVVIIPYDKKLSDKELSAHLKWELQQYIDDDVENYAFDSYKLIQPPPAGNPHLILAGARKRVLAFFQRACKYAGLTLRSVNMDVISAVNAFEANYKFPPKQRIALVEIGERKLVFAVLKGTLLVGYSYLFLDDSFQEDFIGKVTDLISLNLKTLYTDYDLGNEANSFDHVFLYRSTTKYSTAEFVEAANDNAFGIFNPFVKVKLDARVRDQIGSIGDNSEFVEAVGLTVR